VSRPRSRAPSPNRRRGGDRRQERRAATDDDRIAEHAQLVDKAELDSRRGQAGAADRDILVGRVERRSGLLASSAAAASSANDASASRALPWTLSSVRLKTTFGIAHRRSDGVGCRSARREREARGHGAKFVDELLAAYGEPDVEGLETFLKAHALYDVISQACEARRRPRATERAAASLARWRDRRAG